MAKSRVPSKHSRAARRATSPSINTDKSLKEVTLPRDAVSRPSVLAIRQSAGVQKKTKPSRKSRMSTKARRRHDKGLEMAEAVGERTAAKTRRSVGRARVARNRRKPWDDVNKAARVDEGDDQVRAGREGRGQMDADDDPDQEMDTDDGESSAADEQQQQQQQQPVNDTQPEIDEEEIL
ncbi:hypothetical protein CDD80_2822 [Ophiocordyceps camponoti-rufipedis]|uniref:Ribosome biogenesis protein Alb1 n=1 Tax=Ophiocordyceps camponoti-rufipedis TaxID=2004952 RepID=A0A2C5YZ41_9HYPO|nr:hypothetical protein CDD80_2822 [Ophiocordyceps camponoti-rufipedis]